jgi:DNA-binding GntR family transcriptional regulator
MRRKDFASARAHMQEHILQTGEQVRRFYAKGGSTRRGVR